MMSYFPFFRRHIAAPLLGAAAGACSRLVDSGSISESFGVWAYPALATTVVLAGMLYFEEQNNCTKVSATLVLGVAAAALATATIPSTLSALACGAIAGGVGALVGGLAARKFTEVQPQRNNNNPRRPYVALATVADVEAANAEVLIEVAPKDGRNRLVLN